MDARISTDKRVATLITAALDGDLTEGQAKQLAGVNGELGKLAWLAAAGFRDVNCWYQWYRFAVYAGDRP